MQRGVPVDSKAIANQMSQHSKAMGEEMSVDDLIKKLE